MRPERERARRSVRRLAALALVATLPALGCDAPTGGKTATAMAMVLGGAGDDGRFVALTDGQDITLVAGAQGGFHVWVNYRLRGAPAVSVDLLRTAHRQTDGALVLRTDGRIELTPDAGGAYDSPAPLPMFMCPSPIGLSVIDQAIEFALELRDAAGATLAAGSLTLRPHCPVEQASFCQQICSG